jgi:hypothetical protein
VIPLCRSPLRSRPSSRGVPALLGSIIFFESRRNLAEKNRRPPRKRIPIVLAGSALNRGSQKPPQAPPKAKKAKPPKLPVCPHGVKLTLADVETYEQVYGGHLFQFANGDVGPQPFYASACAECSPFCGHGEGLTTQEIASAKASGNRLSLTCPVCVCSTDPVQWNQFLKRIGFSEYRGMSTAKFFVETREGGVIGLGQQKNFVRAGGSKEMDQTDAAQQYDKQNSKRTRRKGHGSDTYSDEQVRVNGLGDPTSYVPSDLVDAAENIRSDSTKEMIAASVTDNEELQDAGKDAEPEHVPEDLRPDKPEQESSTTG